MSEKIFTQEELNEVVQRRLAEAKRKHDADVSSLQTAHESALNELMSEKETLTAKALKVDDLTVQLAEVTNKVHVFEAEQTKRELEARLTTQGVKPDRVEAFARLLGDDKSDEAINKLMGEYPEFIVVEEESVEDKPRMVISGNPSSGNTGGNEKNFAQMSLSERMCLLTSNPMKYKELTKNLN